MKTKAFTLIELLIVIAIIAILALIAIPNFLEAQVRSRVSRVHADMRSFATAVETYTVDYSRCPLGQQEMKYYGIAGDNEVLNYYAQTRLTTPIAYMTSILQDPFIDKTRDPKGRQEYIYHGFLCPGLSGAFVDCFRLGYLWGVESRGPNPAHQAAGGMQAILSDKTKSIVYDPSNGTVSDGVIIRTNKGVFDGTPGH